jgi:hypothetical protein
MSILILSLIVSIPLFAGLLSDSTVGRTPLDKDEKADRLNLACWYRTEGARWRASYRRGPKTRIGRYARRRAAECYQAAKDLVRD